MSSFRSNNDMSWRSKLHKFKSRLVATASNKGIATSNRSKGHRFWVVLCVVVPEWVELLVASSKNSAISDARSP